METDPYDRVKALLKAIKALPALYESEKTIFDVGSRGYYENPTTDLLAFFLNTDEVHGFGSLVLKALFSCTETCSGLDTTLVGNPKREVVTASGKRIDLVLESQNWVMVIENKIFHQQNNPFDDYERFVKDNKNDPRIGDKKPLYIVLSPTGEVARPNWIGISYRTFTSAIKAKLADHFLQHPLNKWSIFLREFVLHLENVMEQPTLDHESVSFVVNHLADFKAAETLQEKAIKSLQSALLHDLQNAVKPELKPTLDNWHGYPAIRFAGVNWVVQSDIVLYLDGRDEKQIVINFYSAQITNNERRSIADAHFCKEDTEQPWNEIKNTYRCYQVRIGEYDYPFIKEKLIEKIILMDEFETQIRPQKINNTEG
ncbi:PDDEXK-like family protein [Salinivibrio sp. MA607]|uniref:PDDEXK-like family protein n=1 Tax=Salinivibrio sp. MA607 TaxID=1909457 RepID=UPI00098973CE|nr:PD-(D/E)XK nuclease family protein [Salinivibrio sp. MA607]OOF03855.1 hypothetical protein BZG81_10935 [Salinivibrio sp. MA607]